MADPSTNAIPIIDSHIHLYPAAELETLAWVTPDAPLNKQHSLDDYASITGRPSSLEGFIFLETDRKSSVEPGTDGSGWEMPLMEVDWLRRIATGKPKDGEGHSAADAALCLAIIPWAPLPGGPLALEKYVKEVENHAGESFGKIRGFRYLLQDKPKGVMLQDGFIEGLKWLGKKGYVFDLGVDQHSHGKWQLEEAVEMVSRAHDGVPEEEKVTFIINHLCKPDLSIYNPTDPSFIAWRTAIYALSSCSNTYMKLSGCFEEMPDSLKRAPVPEVFEAIQSHLAIVLAAFGAFRIMYGSNWPVCTIGVEDSWTKWREVVQRFCYLGGLSTQEQIMIWSGTAIKAYGIKQLL